MTDPSTDPGDPPQPGEPESRRNQDQNLRRFARVGQGQGGPTMADALAIVGARTRAADAAETKLDEVMAKKHTAQTESGLPIAVYERAAAVLRHTNDRRRNSAWEQELGRGADELGASPSDAFRKLRLAMLSAERRAMIDERDENEPTMPKRLRSASLSHKRSFPRRC